MKFDRRPKKQVKTPNRIEKRKPLSSSFFKPNGVMKPALRKKFVLDYITDLVYASDFIQYPEQNIRARLAMLVKEGSITEESAREVFYKNKRFRYANGRIITKKEFSELLVVKKNPILAEKIKLVKDPETFEKILDFVNEHYEKNPDSLLDIRGIKKKFPYV